MAKRWLKQLARKLPALVALTRPLRWRFHLLQDWWGTKVWTRTREVVTPQGFRLVSGLHPAYEQMRRGEFEIHEAALIRGLLSCSDRFIDVGANLGYYTCMALTAGKPALAVEPQPQNLRCLFQNLIANGWQARAEVFPLALSDHPGLLSLYGASGPSASLVKGWAGYSARHRQIVPVSTLDNLLAGRFDGERLLVKIDVEGAEYGVVKGALGSLARVPAPAWVVEICLQEFHPEGANPDFLGVFNLFWAAGYQAYAVGPSPRPVSKQEVEAWWTSRSTSGGTFNYLFLAAGREPPSSTDGQRMLGSP
jgi:FkbM family methyltransferase